MNADIMYECLEASKSREKSWGKFIFQNSPFFFRSYYSNKYIIGIEIKQWQKCRYANLLPAWPSTLRSNDIIECPLYKAL